MLNESKDKIATLIFGRIYWASFGGETPKKLVKINVERLFL